MKLKRSKQSKRSRTAALVAPFVVTTLAACAALALPSRAAAQLTASAGIAAGALGYREVLPSASAGLVDAEVGYSTLYAALAARGRLARFDEDSGSSDGAVALTLRRPAGVRGGGGAVQGSAAATRYRGFAPSRRLDLAAGPTFAFGAYEGSLRGRVARLSLDGDRRNGAGAALLVQRRYRSALLTLSADGLQFDDHSLGFRDTTYFVAGFPFHSRYRAEVDVRRAYVDVEAGVQLALRRALLALTVGGRGGPLPTDPGAWIQLRGTLPLTPHASLVAAFGRAPSVPEERLPSAPFATVALRYSPFAQRMPGAPTVTRSAAPDRGTTPSFAVIGAGGAARLVRLTGVSATRVEIMGDFTDWSPVPLASAGAGVWEATVAVRPGVHRVVIRVDGGAWRAPPDVPVAADEFRGESGVVLVE